MTPGKPSNEDPQPSIRGLATVALLKARFDEGVDHIDMFMPLVLDTIANMATDRFTVVEAQQLLQQRHGIAMPQGTLATLLKRAARKGILKREFASYVRQGPITGLEDLQARKASIEKDQQRLAGAFTDYAREKKNPIGANEEALQLILGFLQDNQVAMLLGANETVFSRKALTDKQTRLVAEFAQITISQDSALTVILKNILEGLVIKNAAFLSDITSPSRQFKGLRIFLDSRLLCQALGYEGDAQAAVALESLQLLKTAGAHCLAFGRTVQEVRGILKIHEDKLATSQGKKSLFPTDISRYFLTKRYTPSDIRQLTALLPQELESIGIQVINMPKRIPNFTLDEKKLAQVLADPHTHAENEPRVIHDVDALPQF